MTPVAIIGCGQIPHVSARDDVDESELIHESVVLALEDANVEAKDIQATVFGSAITSIQDGIEHVGKLVLDACGGRLKPHFRTQTGGTAGAAAALAAVYMVASGEYDLVLAASGTLRSGATGAVAQKALSMAADPVFRRGFSGGALLGLAQTFREYMARYDVTEEAAARCAVQQRANGARNPNAHHRKPVTFDEVMASRPLAPPIKLLDMCPTSVGSAALIVASERVVRRRRKRRDGAWVRGFGSFSEPSTYPHRDPMDALCVRESARKAYRMAGIRNPRKEIDVVELYNAASFQQLIWSEALLLCEPGKGAELFESGATDMGGNLPINPSGGVLCTNNGSDAAMVRIVEAAMQVRGKAGPHQIPHARTALAMGWGGNQQFTSVIVLSNTHG